MRLDRLVGIDGLVTECDGDVAVTGNHLGDVRWQSVHDGFGDKDSAKVVGRVMQGCPSAGSFRPVWTRAPLSMVRSELSLIARISLGNRRWNKTGDAGRHTHSYRS